MGATCGSLNCKSKKYQKQTGATIIRRPTQIDLSVDEENEQLDSRIIVPPDNENCRIGVYFQYDHLIKALDPSQARRATKNSRMEKWHKMISYGLDEDLQSKVIIKKNRTASDPIIFSKYAKIGLNNFYETYPHLFMSRLSKGPPIQYRWLAWKVVSSKKLKSAKGLYEELLTKGKDSIWNHDILKDLDRTFPNLPFFDKDKYGVTGQKALNNSLQAFSIYNEKVGYCQSMNFVLGFILLMNGGNEKEAFWFFATLTKTSNLSSDYPRMEGLRGFYKKNFPLLQQYFHQFDHIFQEELPDLFRHFQDIGIPNLLWLQKWFQSLFLYSFPLGLCIRLWDNVLVYGTRYIFKASIAILRLIQNHLLQLDLSGINDYFKSFKDDEDFRKNKLLPPIETIIEESYRVKLNEEWLDQLKVQYKQLNQPMKEKKQKKNKKLTRVKQKAIKKIEKQQQFELQQQQQQHYQLYQLQQIEEEKIMMEDIQDEEVSRDMQEDQQAKSSENQQFGGSSSGMGGANADLSSGGQVQKKSQFLPQIVNYEDQSRQSLQQRVHSTRNLNHQNSDHLALHQQSNDDIKLPPIHINRNYMIFGSTLNRQDNNSLTYKNSSENFSASYSVSEKESYRISRDAMQRNPSSSSTMNHLNQGSFQAKKLPIPQTSNSNIHQKQQINAKNMQYQKVAHKNKQNIYYQPKQMKMINRLKEQKEIKNINTDDRVREESKEDIQDDELQQPHFDNNYDDEIELTNNKLGESSELVIARLQRNQEIKRGFELSHIDNHNDAENDNEEVQDIVQEMSYNGDHASNYSMQRGESDFTITESNKLNIMEIMNNRGSAVDRDEESGINSQPMIKFVDNLPH